MCSELQWQTVAELRTRAVECPVTGGERWARRGSYAMTQRRSEGKRGKADMLER